MAIPLMFAAIILFAAAYQNRIGQLATNLETDFAGFFPWLVAVLVIAAIGLIPKAKPISYALLGLVFLVLLIANKGFFANLKNLKPISPGAAPAAPGATAREPAGSAGVKKSGDLGPGYRAPTAAESSAIAGGNVISFPGVPDLLGSAGL